MATAHAAVVLFRGDPRREERQKELPPHFLSILHRRLLCMLDTLDGADVFTASGVGTEMTIEGQGRRAEWPTPTLADRVEHTVRFCRESGYERIVLLAGDVALLDREMLRRALAALEDPEPRLVLGTSSDGGFYLAGFNRPPDVCWSTVLEAPASASSALVREASGAGFEIVLADEVDDIDARADAERVIRIRRSDRHLLRLVARLASLLQNLVLAPAPLLAPRSFPRTVYSLRGPPRRSC